MASLEIETYRNSGKWRFPRHQCRPCTEVVSYADQLDLHVQKGMSIIFCNLVN